MISGVLRWYFVDNLWYFSCMRVCMFFRRAWLLSRIWRDIGPVYTEGGRIILGCLIMFPLVYMQRCSDISDGDMVTNKSQKVGTAAMYHWVKSKSTHAPLLCLGCLIEGRGRDRLRGFETPASCTFYSSFTPPSVGIPTSLFYFYCKMLCNIAKFSNFLLLPGSHLESPSFRPLSSGLLYPFPLFSRAASPLSLPL